ncbi:unnamed protein product [Coregonus sp. 'balchen']|nr:unnamed protein product [Coregonus sp. 'balchen']
MLAPLNCVLLVPALGDPPDVPVEDPPDVPVEDPPDVPVEDPPDVPVEDAPDVPVEDPPDVPVEDPPEVPVEDPPDVPMEDPSSPRCSRVSGMRMLALSLRSGSNNDKDVKIQYNITGLEVMKVTATDPDKRGSANSDVRYTIISQDSEQPSPNMLVINPVTGWIRVNAAGLDRENTVSVPENKVNALVVKMPVSDGDEPHSSSWATVYRIVDGDPGGLFTVNTGPNRLEGIITTAKPLDFEKNNRYTLLVTVENEVPFAIRLPTSTATVQVNVEDLNDAPVFDPLCNQDPRLVRLAVTDRDGPDFAEPFSVELLKGSKMYCTAQMDKTGTVVELTFKAMREQRNFYIDLTVSDAGGLNQDHVIHVTMNEDRCMTWGDFCVRP